MADRDENVEVKFRLYDGSDIGPSKYAPSITIGSLKDKIISDWPPEYFQVLRCSSSERLRFRALVLDKKIAPKTTNDLKLIYAGKILENKKTLADSRVPFGELPGGIITMHVVAPPSVPRKKTDKKLEELPKKTRCACTIM